MEKSSAILLVIAALLVVSILYYWLLVSIRATHRGQINHLTARHNKEHKNQNILLGECIKHEEALKIIIRDLHIEIHEIKAKNAKKAERYLQAIRILRKRQVAYSFSITKFKNEDTDIRSIRALAREELSIELQKQGVITYSDSEKYREDLELVEVTATSHIKTLNLK